MKTILSGHFNPEIGRKFEDGFSILLERLGYRIWRKRDTRTGLDVVATFEGLPYYNEEHNTCILQKPIFSPEGVIAFSAKKGDFTKRDIKELRSKIEKSEMVVIDKKKQPITGGIIVTNYSKNESELNKLYAEGIFCWDIIRLFFYANKARICYDLSRNASVKEYSMNNFSCSYLISPYRLEKGIMHINIVIMVDEHKKDQTISADHLISILENIYENSLIPILKSTPLDIQTRSEIHILSLADQELLDSAYVQFAGDLKEHPQITYLRDFKIYSYVSSPWIPFINLLSY